MSDIAILVENLSKRYSIGKSESYKTLRDVIAGTLYGPFRTVSSALKGNKSKAGRLLLHNYIWALKNISFEVKKGEVVGIIGPNGAGKSTLLKILSRITEPTKGYAEINGRVSSLLEVGTGFHSELTGRENIYLNGAILGMKRAEINKKFDEIIEFAGISKFLDTPLKHYSSGMHMRLAFAVAAHLEPEILLVDEVLAVGDIEFQKKCLGKMGQVSKEGRTVLFVSHNMQAISTLVNSCIFLKGGLIIEKGEKNAVINRYLGDTFKEKGNLVYLDLLPSKKPKINRVHLITSKPNNFHINGEPMEIEVEFTLPYKIQKTCITLQIIDKRGIACLDFSYYDSDFVCSSAGVFTLKFKIPKFKLYMGKYNIKVFFAEPPSGELFQVIENICPFEVVMYGKSSGDWEWQPYTTIYLEDYSCSVTQKQN